MSMDWTGCRRRSWGRVRGREASLYTLRNGAGMVARLSDYGGTLVGLELPTPAGPPVDVVLGFDRLTGAPGEAYAQHQHYLGALIGRVANRIAGAAFELDGRRVVLDPNDGANLLHGGPQGFHTRLWAARALNDPDAPGVAFSYRSEDGEGGFPGTVSAEAVYRLGPGPVLRLELGAVSDALTPVSLTHHPYFNLAGHAAGDVLQHDLTLFAARYTPTHADLVPTGAVREVAGTAFDFRAPKTLGRDLADPALGSGYDVNFVVSGAPGTLRPAARLHDALSGRTLEILTTQPGLQLYTGNGLDGSLVGKGGARYGRHAGVALEAQAFPNAVNTPRFPSVWLRPGEMYRQVVEYRFSWAAG
ncbi:MAG: galactose mutarotase [Deinococcales bacterium]